MSEETKSENQLRIEKMDKVAEHLQKLIEATGEDKISETQKSRMFDQLMKWESLRPTLLKAEDGNKIKEMTNGLKSEGGRGKGNTRRSPGKGAGVGVKHSREIRSLIRSLPKIGQAVAGNGGGADGDSSDTKRSGGGAPGNGRELPVDGRSNVAGNANGSRNLN